MSDLHKEIERLYNLKIENKNIARMVGLTISQVNRIIYKVLELQSKNKMASINDIKEAKKLRREGLKLKEIGDRLDCSFNRVKYLLEA